MNRNGLTLIEILMAVIILTVGLIIVLALFPTGIKSAKVSIEDTYSAYLADSFVQALSRAMRSATPEDWTNKKSGRVTMVHDGLSSQDTYSFDLPLPNDPSPPTPKYYLHPCAHNQSHPMGDAVVPPIQSFEQIFQLANSKNFTVLLDDVKSGPDPTDPSAQYGFAFIVRRVDDVRPAQETGPDYRPKAFFEFRIYIFRVPVATGGGYVTPSKIPNPINSFIIQLSGR